MYIYIYVYIYYILVGGFNPSETYISQLGLLFPIYGKIKLPRNLFYKHQERER